MTHEHKNACAVGASNPHYRGIRVRDIDDAFATGFHADIVGKTYATLAEDGHQYGLLLESPTFEEVDSFFNPGVEEVSSAFILEAITVDHFSRTEKRMAAVVRVFNVHLSDSEIQALPPVVGTPKKSGSFAYVTVQIPFSDGQIVSVIFHAPEADKKKIGPNDTIIAFRWLLNKRDITQTVAPEDGNEISLESIAKRITQLVVKNTARFEKQQKAAQEEKKALEVARATLKTAEEHQSELMDSIASAQHNLDTVEARISAALTALEAQKTYNAELEAKIAMLKAQWQHNNKNMQPEAKTEEVERKAFLAQKKKDPIADTELDEPEYLTPLRNIIAGKHDAEGTRAVGNILDMIMDQMDAAGTMEQHESVLNEALDHLTMLLKKKAATLS